MMIAVVSENQITSCERHDIKYVVICEAAQKAENDQIILKEKM